MIQQMIYRRAEQGYRTVAASEGLMGKGLARRIEALSTLPSSGGKKRLGAQPVYSRCAVEDGLAVLMTAVDPGGIRGSHITHAWYVPPEDAAAFATGGAIAADAFRGEYREQSFTDALPGVEPDALPKEDTFALGCGAARSLFGENAQLLSQFLAAVVRCGMPPAGRGFLGACALSGGDEGEVSAQAYRLMETVLRAYAQDQVRSAGYRSLWNKAEDNARYPVFFTTPDLIGAESAVPMNYCLFDLRAGTLRLPRGAALSPDGHDAALARALLDGDVQRIRALRCEAEERIARKRAEEEARRRAEEERIRREAEERARAAEEARKRAEEERIRRAKYEEEQRIARQKAEEEARRRVEQERIRQAEEARRRYEEEQLRRAEEARERARIAAEKQRLYEEEARRRVEEDEARRRKAAEEAEKHRAAEEAEQKRIRDEYLRRKAQAEREAQRQQAAVSSMDAQRSRQEAAAKAPAAQTAKPGELNAFLKALHLTAREIPAHELDRMVDAYMIAVARGRGDTDGAFLDYAARLLREIAAALRSQPLKPLEYAVLAKCAYSVADSALGRLAVNPVSPEALSCIESLRRIDSMLESPGNPAGRSVSRQRRDKWFVCLNVLSGKDERDPMRECVTVIRSMRENNVNNVLEITLRTLGELAADMAEACVDLPVRSSLRNELMRRAALASVYAAIRFDERGRPYWDADVMLGRKVLRALTQMNRRELFMGDMDALIGEITRR